MDNRTEDEKWSKLSADEKYERLMVAYNASEKEVSLDLPEGEWVILADYQETDCRKSVKHTKQVVADGSGIILGKIG